MLSPASKESMNWVRERTGQISVAFEQLNRRLSALADTLGNDADSTRGPKKPLNAAEVAHLCQLNRHLAGLQDFLTATANTLLPALADKVVDLADPMADFEIEAQLQYTLREDDPEYLEDSDNILTERLELLKTPLKATWLGDHRESFSDDADALSAESHCWLFHDLYDHNYGLTGSRVPLGDCLRLGSVFVDVVIRQQYSLNLDTGAWERWAGNRKQVS